MDGTQVPSIPTLPQAPAVQSAAGGLGGPDAIGDLLAPIAAKANSSLPDPYTQGVDVAQPHQKPIPQYQQANDHRTPIAGGVADIKRARRQNAVAGLTNMIGHANQVIEQKKQDGLKDKLVDVMKAKTNVANAQQVLSNPQASSDSKKMAQGVLDANKKQLNDILSDPKHAKQLAKALDISYVDPEKNKTPEVAAFKQATKEYTDAGIFNSDNPQEHAVAQMATKPGLPTNEQQSQQTQQAQPKTGTPYADAALKKDTPNIAENPLYAPALKQQQDAQKQLAAIVPKLIDAESKAQMQAARDGNATARLAFKGAIDLQKAGFEAIAKSNLQSDKDKESMRRVAATNANRFATTKMRVDAALKISEDKRLDKKTSDDIKANSLTALNKEIDTATTTINKDDKALLDLQGQYPKDLKNPEYQSKVATLELQKQMDLNLKDKLQTLRGQKFGDSYNTTNDSLSAGTSNAGSDKSSDDSNDKPLELIGSSESDESDSDDDSDKY